MNIFFIIIISALVFDYCLSYLVRALNLRSLDPSLPEEFSDVYDEKKYSDSQKYTRDKENFSHITSTFSFVLSLLIIFFGLYDVVDQFVRSFGYNEIINGLFFFGVLMIISDLITMPFSLYNNFVIEKRYGFNKMTLSTFFLDKLKGYFLSALIGAPVIALLLYFFEELGSNAWLYAWGLIAVFTLAMQPLFNLFIAPMFNKFTPLEEGPLLAKIKSYLEQVDFPVAKLEVMDGSKRTSHSNAYFSGLGKNKRIALFDTLLESQSDDEIVSVIAHEVGHYKLKHIQKGIVASLIQTGVTLFVLSLFIKNQALFDVFKMQDLSVYGSLIFFSMLYSPISMALGFIFSYISRKNEFEADKYSADTTGHPEHLISSLKKLSAENLGNLTPHWLNVLLNYSHPPVLDRITTLRAIKD